jgi:NDP-sugar pyrophosphorylase family protein
MITDLVLLSGGLATRLRPISHSIPKSLIDINEKPFIEYQLELLKEQGIKNIVVCVGYLGEQIEDLIGDGNKFGLNIRYSYDGDRLLGTAGAIKKALPYLPETFFIMYGDSYLPINFEEVSKLFTTSDKPALMTVIKNDNQWDKSNVIFSENNVIKYDKVNIVPEMNFIDYGLGIVTKTCFNCVGDGEVYDLANIYRDLAEGGKLLGFETEQRFYEVGSFDGIEEFKKIITKK